MCIKISIVKKEKEIKPFKLEKLPKDVREKICKIDFKSGKKFIMMGWVKLRDDLVFDYDGTPCEGFYNRRDLIKLVRKNTMPKAQHKRYREEAGE